MSNSERNIQGWILGIVTALLLAGFIVFLGMWGVDASERADRLEAQLHELTTQNRGPQGPEGDPGRAPSPEEIAAAVADYCAAHGDCRGSQGIAGTPGKDGQDGQSVQGPQGVPGSNGVNGSNGLGITRVQCNGTSISFFAGTALVGTVAMVCIR